MTTTKKEIIHVEGTTPLGERFSVDIPAGTFAPKNEIEETAKAIADEAARLNAAAEARLSSTSAPAPVTNETDGGQPEGEE